MTLYISTVNSHSPIWYPYLFVFVVVFGSVLFFAILLIDCDELKRKPLFPCCSDSSLLLEELGGGLRIPALNTSTLPNIDTPPTGFCNSTHQQISDMN